MPQFAANLTMLFNELPFPDRFAAAKAAGFTAVEYLFPYDCDKAIRPSFISALAASTLQGRSSHQILDHSCVIQLRTRHFVRKTYWSALLQRPSKEILMR